MNRERLQKLAEDAKEKKKAKAERVAAQVADDAMRTRDIADWGKTLLPFTLETKHELRVDLIPGYNFGWDDDNYVFFWVTHKGWEHTGRIPLLAARCKTGAFELRILGHNAKVFNLIDQLKEAITECLATVDSDFMLRGIHRYCRETQWTRLY
jgi:hypothetical protein